MNQLLINIAKRLVCKAIKLNTEEYKIQVSYKYIKGVFYPFRDVENDGYSSNGSYIYNYTDHKFDLICECVPDILDKYMDKDITQKELIQQHIDYYTKVKNESVIN